MGTTEKTGNTPLPLAEQRRRHLPAGAAFDWLAAGWRDLWRNPLPSLLYGFAVFQVLNLAVVYRIKQKHSVGMRKYNFI